MQGIIKDSDTSDTKKGDSNIKDDSIIDLTMSDFKFNTLEAAVTAGKQLYPTCRGITMEGETYVILNTYNSNTLTTTRWYVYFKERQPAHQIIIV